MLVGIFGKLGDGKTLLLTLLMYLRKLENYKVFTNYYTTFSDKIASAEELLLDLSEELPSKKDKPIQRVFGLDELGLVIQARHFMSSANEILNVIFRRTRKLGTDVYYTSQSLNMVDINVRRITDIVIGVSYSPSLKEVTAEFYEKGIFDYEYSHSQTYDASPYFDKYDTNEVIEINEGKILDKMVERIKSNKKVLSQINAVTQYNTKIHLIKFETQLSRSWCSIVYARLKEEGLIV